jgi:tricorn protease
MTETAYLRQPSLHGDTLVFVCDDDLWRASASGGAATRLTAGLSEPATPCLSPDGRWVAFICRDEQHPEVYLMSIDGGPSRRLTWLGPDTLVRGWTPQGHILFVSTWGQPFFRNHQAYTLDPAGGLPVPLQLGQVNHLAFGPGQARVIGRNTADPARWKRYRGGTAGHLWIDAEGNGEFRRMRELPGNISSPMWLGGRIYHLSDAEGVGNLYSCRPDGSDLRRHTDHDRYYARHAQSDGRRIVYQHAARLWLFEPDTDTHRPIELSLPGARSQAARRFVPAAQNLRLARLHPAGHSVALDVRGKLYTMPLWEGAVRQHGRADGVRYRFGQWLADGRTLVTVSDASGEERLEVHGDDDVRVLDWDLGHVSGLRAAPTGSSVAIANHRNQLLLGNVAGNDCHVVDHGDAGRIEDLAWSADGRWLAYSFQTSARQRAIKLCEVATRRCTLVTQPEFRDYCPSFDPQGRYLYFLSYRTFDPVYDSVQFEMSFPRAARPYLLALQAGGRPPFDPEPKGLKGGDKDDKADTGAADKAEPMRVDLEGIQARIAAFPVDEARFGKIAGADQGKVAWTVLPIEGQQGRGGHKEGAGRLEVFDFETRRADTLMDKCDDFELAADHTTLLVRDGPRLRAIAVDHREDRRADAGDDSSFSRKTGWIDMARVRVSVDPRAEWRQMLREVWRLQRDLFWVEDMSGVDWPAMLRRYEPLLDGVATRAELSDLIWELQGELGTSHAYEFDGDHRKPPPWALGHLAADWRLTEGDESYEITRIVRGDAWDGQADSPLHAVGVEARVGERIVAINGQRVSRTRPPQALLVNQAGAKVELTLADASGQRTRRVLVKTLADEVPARYREWVERNRSWVHAESKERVGYLHLPDMMADGFAEFHRYFGTECDRDALIVDLRYNRGGHVSELLLEKVARKRIAYSVSRWGRTVPYPDESAAGPVVALCNEHAGSDGDIFAHSFKLMGLGPLVGTRTWGGVIGIWPRHLLVDGTETTQPEYSFWFRDVGWGVENHGTEPTIEVDNAPQDAAAGRDRQLETALATALQRCPPGAGTSPAMDQRPNLAPPKLPQR